MTTTENRDRDRDRDRDVHVFRKMLLQVAAALAVWGLAAAALTRNPSFADGPYNSALGALGSRDKAIVSFPGLAITPLFASDGAKGMGRDLALVGGSVRLGLARQAAGAEQAPPVYDPAEPAAPVLLLNDGAAVAARVMHADSGARAAGEGVLLELLARADATVNASVDWSPGVHAAESGRVLNSAAGMPLLCTPVATATSPPASGHVAASGFRAGRVPAAARFPAATPAWASTYATAGNFPGQSGLVGKTAKAVSYKLAAGAALGQKLVYVAVGLADPGYNAAFPPPSKLQPAPSMQVECSGTKATLALPKFGAQPLVYYLKATADAKGDIVCSFGKSAGRDRGHYVSALWLFTQKTTAGAAAAHACDASGVDAKGGHCLRMWPCNASVPEQRFKRSQCPTLHGPRSAPPASDCLSYKTKSGAVRFLNAELWSSCNASSPGPLISYSTFVFPSECGGKNQFWSFVPSGEANTIQMMLTSTGGLNVRVLTADAKTGLASLLPFVPFLATQLWVVPPRSKYWPDATTSQLKLKGSNALCVDASAPPPAPTLQPVKPADLGEQLAFVDAGSDSDLPSDVPSLSIPLKAGVKTYLFLPPGNASTFAPCLASQAAAEALWNSTVATWQARKARWGSISVPDKRMARALEVAQFTLLSMTETQWDGLRVLKSPIHYYGSDPYDTYRATTALMRWGRTDLSQEVLTRQLGRRCPSGTWEMWEVDPPAKTTPLFIVQGLASEAVLEQWKFTGNKNWAQLAYPALASTANATIALRSACSCAGLLPMSGGDGGLPHGHVFVQEAGALFGLQCVAQAAAAVGDAAASARFKAEFDSFKVALLASEAKNYDAAHNVLGMTASDRLNKTWQCCAWGAVDVLYPFPLINASTSTRAESSLAFWTAPNRTDPFGLHLKLGYSQRPWAYLEADLGHIHLQRGEHAAAMAVLQAMVNNSSPTVSTYEEFETGPSPKMSWGGIPDIWFTSELMNLIRDVMINEAAADGALDLYHGAPQAWRTGSYLTLRGMPTRLGVRVSVNATWSAARSTFSVRLATSSASEERPKKVMVRLYVGSCRGVEVVSAHGSCDDRAGVVHLSLATDTQHSLAVLHAR